MEAGRSPLLKWSDNTYPITDVALKKEFNLPLLVKVEEGICGKNESESFSQNDLIKIDSVKIILKVVACCVDYQGRANTELRAISEDEHGYIEKTEELTIPLRYKGVVNIFHREVGEKIYCGVSEMLKDCPRYVDVLDSFTDKNEVSVPAESVLELDGIVSCRGLVCYLVDRPNCTRRTEIVLEYSNKCRFRRIPDNTDYTLQEVTSRFPLPQYVTFKKESGPKLVTTNIEEAVAHSRIFEGTVAIKRRIKQDYIIGHYKPPDSVANNTTDQCQRTLVMIPLNSPTARDLNVRVSLNTQDGDDYELLMARNFSQKDVSEGEIDGTVYMDFLKTPKSTFIVYDEIKMPPPRPLRGKVVKTTQIYPPLSSPPDPSSPPPPIPPRQDDRGYSIPGRIGIDKNLADAVTKSQNTPPTSPHSSSPQCPPRKGNAKMRLNTPDGQTDTNSGRNNIERTKEESVTKSQNTPPTSPHSSSPQCPPRNGNAKMRLNILDGQTDTNSGRNNIERKKEESENIGVQISLWRQLFESFDSSELYQYLTKIGLDTMAIRCRDRQLTGAHFNNMTDDELKAEFTLSPIQLLKFRQMQNRGWNIKEI